MGNTFELYHNAISIERFKDFLMKMVQNMCGRMIILMLDDFWVHHANDLQSWHEENKDKIESLRVSFPEACFVDPKSLAREIPHSLLRGGLFNAI